MCCIAFVPVSSSRRLLPTKENVWQEIFSKTLQATAITCILARVRHNCYLCRKILIAQNVNLLPAFARCLLNSALEQTVMEGDDLLTDQAMTLLISLDTDFWRDIKDEKAGMIIMALCQPQQTFARFWLQRGAIGNRKTVLQ